MMPDRLAQMERDADVTPVGVDPGVARLPGHVRVLTAEVRRLTGLLEPVNQVRQIALLAFHNGNLRGSLEVIAAAIDAWEDGDIAPVDALSAIRGQVRGAPIPEEGCVDAEPS